MAQEAEAVDGPILPGKKGKKGKVKATDVLWTTRVTLLWGAIQGAAVEVFRSLSSADPPTRWMARVFAAALCAAVLVTGVAGDRYLEYRHARLAALAHQQKGESMLAGFLKKQSDLARRRNVMFPLGQFTLELRSPASVGEEHGHSVMNLAELDIVVECDSREARFFLEDNLAQARNQVTDALTAIDRTELLSADGKLRLKRRLIERLNTFLPMGKVENLYFSKLVLS